MLHQAVLIQHSPLQLCPLLACAQPGLKITKTFPDTRNAQLTSVRALGKLSLVVDPGFTPWSPMELSLELGPQGGLSQAPLLGPACICHLFSAGIARINLD